MLHEPALADPWRPLNQDCATAALAGGVEPLGDDRELAIALEQPAPETAVAAGLLTRIWLSPQVLDPRGQGTPPFHPRLTPMIPRIEDLGQILPVR
jgi:hypothetical protein